MSEKRTKDFSNNIRSRFQALLKDTPNEDSNIHNATLANTQQDQTKNTGNTNESTMLGNNTMHSKKSLEENMNP